MLGSWVLLALALASSPSSALDGSLPYVENIQVLPQSSCRVSERVCAGDSLVVLVRGQFPSDRHRLVSVEMLAAGEPDQPAVMRLVVDDGACLDGPPESGPVRWLAQATIGPLAAEDYLQVVRLQLMSCGVPIGAELEARELFTVVPSPYCSRPPCECLDMVLIDSMPPVVWNEGSAFYFACNLHVSVGVPRQIRVGVRAPVALTGLEGTLTLTGDGLRIIGIEAIGPVAGSSVAWTPTSGGGRFALSVREGASIPPAPYESHVPVLAITVELDADHADSRFTLTCGWSARGRDADGGSVPACEPNDHQFLIPPTFVTCVEGEQCDFNQDAVVDVRDLVRMTRCLFEPTCPRPLFDCDRDGRFDLDDVRCCAAEVLRRPDCAECPVDTVRAEPGIGVEFGSVIETAEGVSVPIHLLDFHRIGAAKLRIRFPAEVYTVSGFEAHAAIDLFEVQGDQVVLGVIGPSQVVVPLSSSPSPPLMVLHFARRPDRPSDGEAVLVGGDFSGWDGVKLDVDLGSARVPLRVEPRWDASVPRPNPFEGETRFSVRLPARTFLDVGIYDVSGRRVATVFRGLAEAGAHPFTWDGRDANRARAPGGVYFYRVAADGVALARRMVMLAGR